MKKVFICFLILSILGFLFFVERWIVIDGGNDAWATLFSGLLIPLFLALIARSSKKKNGQEQLASSHTEPSPDFSVTISKAEIIADSEYADYRFQIEVSMNAVGRSVYIRNIRLECSDFVWSKPVINLVSYFKNTGEDYLYLSTNDYCDKIKTLNKAHTDSMIIRDDEWQYCLFTDETHSERLPDGYEDFELDNWNMIITYNDNQVKTIPFSFNVHRNSHQVPTEYMYTGFKGLKR